MNSGATTMSRCAPADHSGSGDPSSDESSNLVTSRGHFFGLRHNRANDRRIAFYSIFMRQAVRLAP